MSFQPDDFLNSTEPRPLMSEINMTPFVDVCLVLLIIFMVAAPFAVSGVNVKLPKTQSKSMSINQNSLILSITQKGEYFLGKYHIKEKNLVSAIQQAKQGQEQSAIFIKADKDVPYSKVMVAMVAAQKADIQKIGMIGENNGSQN